MGSRLTTKATEDLVEKGQRTTLESAIEGMNQNARALEETAAMLRKERSENDELRLSMEVAVSLICSLKTQLARRCGNSALTRIADGFIEGSEVISATMMPMPKD